MPRIYKMLDLSTKHLPEEVCEDLSSYEGVVADERTYGWLLWVPDDIDERIREYQVDEGDPVDDIFPPAVVDIWRFAAKHECQYVLLDQDGPEYNDLPSHEW